MLHLSRSVISLAAIVGLGTIGMAQQPAASPAPRTPQTTTTAKASSHKRRSAAKPSPVVPADPPPPPPTPEQMPPQPPHVEYINGLLSISANNSTLGDVLQAIRARTGANIDAPGGLSERVAVHLGPAPPRQVIADLLQGSRYDYVLVGSDTDPNAVRSVLITVNNGAPASPAAPSPQPSQVRNQPPEEEIPDSEAEGEVAPQPVPAQTRPMARPPVPPGQMAQPGQIPQPGQPAQPGQAVIPGQPPTGYAPAPTGAQAGQQPRVKTPEELLQELQRMQQQQQQQQQQQPQ